MLWLIILMGLIVALLIYWEYQDHDCLPHKNCNRSCSKPLDSDSTLKSIDKVKNMVKNNYTYVNWRLALLAGIIGALPVVYYIEGRVPTLFEWIIVGGLIFAAAYLSSSWIYAHFFYPNGHEIEKQLVHIRDKVSKILNDCREPTSSEYLDSLINSDL